MRTEMQAALRLRLIVASAIGAVALLGGAASADPQSDRPPQQRQDNRDQGEHRDWGQDRGNDYAYRRGERMGYNDWNNSPVVDYRARHLRRPRQGYEWREHNGRYVMVAIATGLIASVLLNNR